MARLSASGQRLLLVLVALSLGLAGCVGGAGAGAPSATPRVAQSEVTVPAPAVPAAVSTVPPTATPTSLPATATPPPATATPAATATPQPPATAAPSATPRPSPTPASPARSTAAPGAQASAGPGGTKEAFIREIAPFAQAEEADSGVPAAFSIALAASETGWGVSPLMKQANSYLGLTCSTPNEGLPCVTYRGVQWNAYSSPLNAFLWHGRWLRAHSQFAAAFQHTGDVAAFTHEIWRCYVSCSVPYPQSEYNGTMALIAQYNLEQYDGKH